MFGNLTTEGTEKVQDRLGGNSAFGADIYTGIIKQFYGITARSEAKGVELIVEIDGREYRETLYVTSGKEKGGTNRYIKDGKEYLLPGFITINDICLCAVGKELKDLEFEERQVRFYNFEERKEELKAAPVAIEMIGQEISFALKHTKQNKQKKNDSTGKYEDVAGEFRETNEIDKVFNTATRQTVSEARDQSDPLFWDKWLDRNKGQMIDKTTGGTAGGSAGGPPKKSSEAPAPAKTGNALFGKK